MKRTAISNVFIACSTLVLASGATRVVAEPVTVPAGMTVELELQHHVNSAFVPTGTPIYFRVFKDVVISGKTVVAKGQLVTGKMEAAQERGMVGKSGSMTLGVNTVQAVDHSNVPIEADLSKQGRSRSGATVAWTLFWGLPGLMTRGVNPYLEKGMTISGTTLREVSIEPDPPPAPASEAPAAEAPAPLALGVTAHKQEGGSKNKEIVFDIERNTKLKTINFTLDAPTELAGADVLGTLELVAVDGVAVPEKVAAVSHTGNSATFDGWSVVRYCGNGRTVLTFSGKAADGRVFTGTYPLPVKVKKKG